MDQTFDIEMTISLPRSMLGKIETRKMLNQSRNHSNIFKNFVKSKVKYF